VIQCRVSCSLHGACVAIKSSFLPRVYMPSLVAAYSSILSFNHFTMTKGSVVTAAATLAVLTSAAPGGGHNKPGRPGGYGGGYGGHGSKSENWSLKKFTSLVAFGDSYTDDSRLGYFGSHNGSAPPVGWVDPAVSQNDAHSCVHIHC
jgi:hypothetical protein